MHLPNKDSSGRWWRRDDTDAKDSDKFKGWCNALFGRDDLPVNKIDARILAAHFPTGSLVADVKSKSPTGETVVNVREGALPSRTSEDIFKASRDALA